MNSIKETLQSIRESNSTKQVVFVLVAVILFILLAWFVVNNFIFMVDNLNQTFGSNVTDQPESISFDIESFQELNLIR